MISLQEQIEDVLESARYLISNVKPSVWTEEHRVMTSGVSPFPGKFSYDRTPYLREIVDCLQRSHPAKEIAVMKGAQIGFSTGVIESGIGYIISEDPGPVLFLTGHADLTEEAMSGKIDQMIDSCGLRSLIRPQVLRARNQRTGDTNKSKEFPGGSVTGGGANNHKLLRQRSAQYGFNDDLEAARNKSGESGNTVDLIRQRYAAYETKKKIYWISTPETTQNSNILPLFLRGDQRRYFIPCPCCGTYIPLFWDVIANYDEREKAGITWKLDESGYVVPGSVGYICQDCGDFFDEKEKSEFLLRGKWEATAVPAAPGLYSYHLSALYAPPGMSTWEDYVRQYLEACPPNKPVKEDKFQTFTNLCLGEPYQPAGEAPKANDLQNNQIDYSIGMIPEKISEQHGNGKIILITCSCDLNGTPDDARLDWEVVAWSETGSRYSIDHGSIGTFVPREGSKRIKEDRERFTYQHNKPNSVWPIFIDTVVTKIYEVDTGRKMKIFITGVDCGYHTDFAYKFIDLYSGRGLIVGLKGKDKNKYIRFSADLPSFRPAKERSKLYLVEVGRIKDRLAETIKLRYDNRNDQAQPPGFMNFPLPQGNKYLYKTYFSHFESEHCVIQSESGEGISAMWVKKGSTVMNHFWDVCVYNNVLKDVITSIICKQVGIKNYSWTDYVDIMLGRYKK